MDELTASGGLRVLTNRKELRAVLAYHHRVDAAQFTYHFFWRKMADGLWPALKQAAGDEVLPFLTRRAFYEGFEDDPVPEVRLRKTPELRSCLYDQLETLFILKAELQLYRELCIEARQAVA